MTPSKTNQTVFIGAVTGYRNLADIALADALVAANIGLYGHGTSQTWAANAGYAKDITAAMKVAQPGGSAAGVAELGFDYNMDYGTVVLTNTGTSSITLTAGSVTFTGPAGQQYLLTGNTAPPSREGYQYDNAMTYTIAAGQSATVYVESATAGTAGSLASGSVLTMHDATGQDTSKVSVALTSAIAGSNGDSLDKNGQSLWSTDPYSGSLAAAWYAQGFPASEANVNVPNNYVMTANDLQSWQSWVSNVRATGVMNVAGIFNQIGETSWLGSTIDFPTGMDATTRSAILYGGGIAIDMPAQFGLILSNGSHYLDNTMAEIKWAKSEGLRVSWIISPFAEGTTNATRLYDSNMLDEVKQMVSILQAHDAMPTQIIVENYNTDDTGGINTPDASDPQGLDKIAEYVATLNLTPSNAEAGLQVAGQAGAKLMMSGIRPNASIAYGATGAMYDVPSIFAQYASTQITMRISVDLDGLSLSAAGASISNNGKVLTATGTQAELTQVLQGLRVTDTLESTTGGSAQVTLDFTSSDSAIEGYTTLAYGASPAVHITIAQGVSQVLHSDQQRMEFVSQGGSLVATGSASLTAVGTYQDITASSTGSDNLLALALTGNGVLTNLAGQSGITVESGASLALHNAAAFLQVNGGQVQKDGDASLTANGVLTGMDITGARNYLNVALTGAGRIHGASGTLGITLDSPAANLVVEDSVAYVTAHAGTVSTGNGAYVNLYGNTVGGIIQGNVNGGVLAYVANGTNNANLFVGAGAARVQFGGGYTAIYQDFSAGGISQSWGLNGANGMILATHLHATNDVSIAYVGGAAIVSEAGNAGHAIIHGVQDGGLDLYTAMGGTDFSAMMGTPSLLLGVGRATALDVVTSGSYTMGMGHMAVSVQDAGAHTITAQAGGAITIDTSRASSVSVQNSGASGLGILLTQVSSGATPTVSYDGRTTHVGVGSSAITLDGLYTVGSTDRVGGVDLSQVTDSHSLLLSLSAR